MRWDASRWHVSRPTSSTSPSLLFLNSTSDVTQVSSTHIQRCRSRGNLPNRISRVDTDSDHLTRPVKEHADPSPSAFRPKNFYFPSGSTMKLIYPPTSSCHSAIRKQKTAYPHPDSSYLFHNLICFINILISHQQKPFILSVKKQQLVPVVPLIVSPNHQTQIASLHTIISSSALALRTQLNCLNCPLSLRSQNMETACDSPP